jgi:predicted RNase H-like HicB family nuclease
MTFDPDTYTITIRKEIVDGQACYVGKVTEFQNVSAYEDTYEEALTTIRDVLTAIAKSAERKGQPLPVPQGETGENPSGRITLRMPRSLHAKVLRRAEQDETSANQVINTAIAEYTSEMDATSKIAEIIRNTIENHAPMTTYVTRESVMFNMAEPEMWHGFHGTQKSSPARASNRKSGYGRKPS